MDLLLAIFTSGLAAFIWLFLFRTIDHFKTERWPPILGFFGLGCLSISVPMLIPEIFPVVDFSVKSVLLNQLVGVALVEESGKLLFLIIGMAMAKKLFVDTPNFMIYGACVGLGFGFVENIAYAVKYGNIVLHYREIISLSLHALCTGIAAYGISRLRSANPASVIVWFLTAILVHGLYNSGFVLVEEHPVYVVLPYVVFLVAVEMFSVMLNNAINKSDFFSDGIPFPARAIRITITGCFVLLFAIFIGFYVSKYGFEGVGSFLILSSPLLFILFIMVNRLTSMVLVKGKQFPITPSFPFIIGGMDLGIPGFARPRLSVKGLPYYEEPFLTHFEKRISIRPISHNFDYFGDSADIEIVEKVYAASQMLFYRIKFHSSDDPVHEDRFFYLIPKLTGVMETEKHFIAGLISRNELIDSSNEDLNSGSFCAWIYIEKVKEVSVFQQFRVLLNS